MPKFYCPAQPRPKAQQGLSMIELMISLVIGLLITAAVGTVFISGGKNYRDNDRFARMQENGRFAINMIANDLVMASFWGTLTVFPNITPAISPGTSCNVTHSPQKSVVVVNSATSVSAASYCIDMTTFRSGTGTIAIKYVDTNSVTSGQAMGKAYLRTAISTGQLILYDGTAPGTGEADWPYIARVYYLRDIPDPNNGSRTIPVLARKYLVGASMNNDETLLDGIEDLHVEVGVNKQSKTDIIPTYYDPAPAVTDMPYVVTARIYVLVRSPEPDVVPINKTYRLGSKPVPRNDNYRRKVFTTTVVLRNPNYQLRVNSPTDL